MKPRHRRGFAFLLIEAIHHEDLNFSINSTDYREGANVNFAPPPSDFQNFTPDTTFHFLHLQSRISQSTMAVEIKNKKANYQYFLEDHFTAGILLQGSEIKSIRAGKASIQEAYCKITGDEVFIYNMYIAEYQNSGFFDHEPRRARKLLLNRHEINKIIRKSKDVGFTLVPVKLFISEKGWAKLEFAIARGKKLHDKREDIKAKDIKRDLDRLKNF